MKKKSLIRRSASVVCAIILFVAGLFAFDFFYETQHPEYRTSSKHIRYRYEHMAPEKSRIDGEMAYFKKRYSESKHILDGFPLAQSYARKGALSGDDQLLTQAKDLAENILKSAPALIEANVVLAEVANARHNFEETIERTTYLLRKVQNDAALSLRIIARLARGELELANKEADLLLKWQPTAEEHALKGLVLERLGNDADAIKYYHAAIELEDFGQWQTSNWVRNLLARFHLRWGNYRIADKLLAEAERIYPNQPMTLQLRADLEKRRGNYKKATQYLTRAFDQSRNPAFLIDLARVKEAEGKKNSAKQSWQLALSILEQQQAQSLLGHGFEFAQALANTNDSERLTQAVKLTRSYLGKRKDPVAVHASARVLIRSKHWDEAKSTLSRLEQQGYQDPQTYLLTAQAELGLGNKQRAREQLSLAKDMDPKYPGVKELSQKLS